MVLISPSWWVDKPATDVWAWIAEWQTFLNGAQVLRPSSVSVSPFPSSPVLGCSFFFLLPLQPQDTILSFLDFCSFPPPPSPNPMPSSCPFLLFHKLWTQTWSHTNFDSPPPFPPAKWLLLNLNPWNTGSCLMAADLWFIVNLAWLWLSGVSFQATVFHVTFQPRWWELQNPRILCVLHWTAVKHVVVCHSLLSGIIGLHHCDGETASGCSISQLNTWKSTFCYARHAVWQHSLTSVAEDLKESLARFCCYLEGLVCFQGGIWLK